MGTMCYGESTSRKTEPVRIDLAENSLVTMDVAHHKVHKGLFFTANLLQKAVLNNGFVRLYLKTCEERTAHILITLDVEGKCYFKSYSDPVVSNVGTGPDATNLTVFNRRGVNGNTMLVYYAPTFTGGTLRGNRLIPAGTGGLAIGSTLSTEIETIISRGTGFIIELQNVSGQSRDLGISVNWYEEEFIT